MSQIGVSFRFEWNGEQVARDVTSAAQQGLNRAGFVLQRQMKENLSVASPMVGMSAGGFPGKDTGELRRSIATNETPGKVRVGTPLNYGRWLEYGFKSSAKSGKALPVPLNREARRMLRQAQNAGGLRAFAPNLVQINRRGKPPLLVLTTGKGTRGGKAWKPMFVLKKSVTIAPRPWVLRSAAMCGDRMNAAFIGEATRALKASIMGRVGRAA